MSLDLIDRKILHLLQIDGRMTNLELSAKANLSPTACQNRVKKLEAAGIISGYQAVVDHTALGCNIRCLILIRMNSNSKESVRSLAEAIRQIKAVQSCYLTSGRIDYVVQLLARDFAHYESIFLNEITKLPDVESTETLFAIGNDHADHPMHLEAILQ